ncbi:MAG TPA: hypothetical protein VK139_02260 [Microbacteriaceae bacterium]|nr:hypothetical protein [Microbacteriaceae bacterium]
MRKSLFALAAVSTTFAVTAAGATGYTLTVSPSPVSISSTGEASVTTQSCPAATSVTTSFTISNLVITGVVITTNDSTCTAPAQVTLSNAAGTTNVVYSINALSSGAGTALPVSSGWNLDTGGTGTVAKATVVLAPGS